MGCIDKGRGFLSRLAHDVRGNTLAIMAAAMLPLAGLIGGGVDMSRLYLVKTRLQQACDAGALAGRKAMGPDGWTKVADVGSASTEAKANTMFGVNFVQGQYGTGTTNATYSESDGTVNGTVYTTVPMTIMKIFGMSQRRVGVSCNAKMEIPNTDVMFVLDVTGSMNCAPGTTCNNSTPVAGAKITGLKHAVKCFYEVLERVNTSEVCGNDPTATTSSTTAQIRFGFVPYTVNVNVGRLLPNDYLADSWTYQTRVAASAPQSVWAWTLGSTIDGQQWSNWTNPSSVFTTNNFNSFSTVAGPQTMNDGTVLTSTIAGANSNNCVNNNTLGTGSSSTRMAGIQDSSTGNVSAGTWNPTNQNPPVYPATTQNQGASGTRSNTINYGYKYTWTGGACTLQRATPRSNKTTYTQTGSGTATKTISWTQYSNVITSWTYKSASLNVSGLKAGGSTWNNSVSLPIGAATPVTLSGSNNTSNVYTPSATVDWDGCIEERQTHSISDTTQTTINADFIPIPSDANDLNIDMLPVAGQTATLWGPALPDAFWARYGINNDVNCSSTGNTVNNVTTNCNLSHNDSYYCPPAASRLTTYSTATNFEAYVNGLAAGGNTYHDIGLLWGARLISPTGLFAASNAMTPGGQAIQRHIIFMTDGATQTANTNYTAYGVGWWSRKQTSYAPSSTNLDYIVNARTDALCTAIKNMNITLWVVSFGGGVDAATETRLSNCATPNHYYSAADNATLMANFRDIASKISELRLTS